MTLSQIITDKEGIIKVAIKEDDKMVVHVTSKNFNEEVLMTDKTVLIDFWAPWCGPCRMLGPVIEEVATEVPSQYKICKVNVDEEEQLASQFKVYSIPTVVVMKDKKIIKQTVGYQPKQTIKKMLGL